MKLKLSIIAAVAALAAGSASAVPLTTGWAAAANVEGGSAFGPSSVTGNTVTFSGNSDRTAVNQDNPASGNYSFSGTLQSTGNDDDTLGMTFGYVDGMNNYRLGWEGGGDWDFEFGGPSGTGNNGLWLIAESGGTVTSLFSNDTLFWARGVVYDWVINVVDGNISFEVSQNGNVLESQTVAATRSTDGLVGVYANSQSGIFTELDLAPIAVAPIPLPAGGALLITGLGLLALRRRT